MTERASHLCVFDMHVRVGYANSVRGCRLPPGAPRWPPRLGARALQRSPVCRLCLAGSHLRAKARWQKPSGTRLRLSFNDVAAAPLCRGLCDRYPRDGTCPAQWSRSDRYPLAGFARLSGAWLTSARPSSRTSPSSAAAHGLGRPPRLPLASSEALSLRLRPGLSTDTLP